MSVVKKLFYGKKKVFDETEMKKKVVEVSRNDFGLVKGKSGAESFNLTSCALFPNDFTISQLNTNQGWYEYLFALIYIIAIAHDSERDKIVRGWNLELVHFLTAIKFANGRMVLYYQPRQVQDGSLFWVTNESLAIKRMFYSNRMSDQKLLGWLKMIALC